MAKTFLIDVAKCNGCRNCQVVCKDEHCGTDWRPYALSQPDTGQFWIKVDERVRGTVPKVKMGYLPHGCMLCEQAPCIEAAVDDAVYRRPDGIVIIDPEKAKGQRAIADACPYGAVFYNEELDVAQKCTGCAHLLDDGWEVPRCVDACPTGALRFVDEAEANERADAAEFPYPDHGCSPRVRYLNLPKRFVAGEAYDRELDEVLIGCSAKLYRGDAMVAETVTDEFGNFWFDQVEPAAYRVELSMGGHLPRSLEADATSADVNVGAIALAAVEE